jgi:hypothetical protein
MIPGSPQNGNTFVRSAAMETSTSFNAVFIGHFLDSFIIWRGYNNAVVGRSGKERDEGMLLQMKEGSRIENPREYTAHAVGELRDLLAVGGQAECDPHRENFYQVENSNNTFYIYVSPITGNIILLAKWSRQPRTCYVDAASLVA